MALRDRLRLAAVIEWLLRHDDGGVESTIDDATAAHARALARAAAIDRVVAMERWLGDDESGALARITRACERAEEAAEAVAARVDPRPELADAPIRDQFGALLSHYDALVRGLKPILTPPNLALAGAIVRVALPLAAIAFFGHVVYKMRTFVHAVASASYSAKFEGRYAVDGRTDTAWVPPDNMNASLDLELMPPRRVMTVRMLDTRNAPHNDRQMIEFRLEFFRDGRAVDAVEGSFPLPEDRNDPPHWIRVPVNRDWKVEKVRFVIKSHARRGGGLAEIEFH